MKEKLVDACDALCETHHSNLHGSQRGDWRLTQTIRFDNCLLNSSLPTSSHSLSPTSGLPGGNGESGGSMARPSSSCRAGSSRRPRSPTTFYHTLYPARVKGAGSCWGCFARNAKRRTKGAPKTRNELRGVLIWRTKSFRDSRVQAGRSTRRLSARHEFTIK